MDILEGYWYCDEILDSNFVRDDMQIKSVTNKPPYLVVNQSPQSIKLFGSDWPGELWRVRVLELGDMSDLATHSHFWRANVIMLIKRLPLSELFGVHGEKVVALLAQIQSLSMEQVDVISSVTNPHARIVCSQAWERWNRSLEHPREHLFGLYNAGTLAMPSRDDELMSPINHGFALICYLVNKKAQELEGDYAFTEVDYDGEIETVYTPKWSKVADAFYHAAMAFGTSEHLSREDYEVLVAAWQSVFTII